MYSLVKKHQANIFFFGLVLLACSLMAVLFYTNEIEWHNTLLSLNHQVLFTVLIIVCVYYPAGILLQSHFLRIGLLMQAVGKSFLLWFISCIAAPILLTTPFPSADHLLQSWDEAIGFHLIEVMRWFHQFPQLIQALQFAYDSCYFQVVLVPMILALFGDAKALKSFFIAWLVSLIICALIYYCLPAGGPAGVLSSSLFSAHDKVFALQFYESHHDIHAKLMSFGIISIPSAHVISAMLLTYYVKQIKWIFYPLAMLNTLLVISTIALGKHFLVDIFAAIPVALFSIWVGDRMTQ